jgi:hypothetical protein
LLGENEIPPWMELDCLYFFKYDKKGDTTEFLKKITGSQILLSEISNDTSLKGKFNIQIELKGKMYFFAYQFATFAQKWLNCLKRAKKSAEEITRIKCDKIYRNIDPLIELFRLKVHFHLQILQHQIYLC